MFWNGEIKNITKRFTSYSFANQNFPKIENTTQNKVSSEKPSITANMKKRLPDS
jgi:hypothetical protein